MENSEIKNDVKAENSASTDTFKKPVLLIGKIGRLPKKLSSSDNLSTEKAPKVNEEKSPPEELPVPRKEPELTSQVADSRTLEVSYDEPSWAGMPDSQAKPYALEVLKDGSIVETIKMNHIMKKSFFVLGRSINCEVIVQNPSVSRHHVIFQYRSVASESNPTGFYVYDLDSTHGTFLNGKHNKIKPKQYVRFRVGHMLRVGQSQRCYILTGPEDDQEPESDLTVTELKQLKEQKIREHQEKMRQLELEMEEKRKREEERGVDWGMGDDASDEEDDKTVENPYATTNNEELYLDDPKKALRGFFEREGLDMQYNCTEQGMGQFLCKVELPLDDELGRPIVAEVLHRGKKKEAVVQCALEACKILDRFGVLRQATHESRKRKSKNWEENDYYDSDEDTFLDRTGTIEMKREKRMRVKEPKAETYESLIQKDCELKASIERIQDKLREAERLQTSSSNEPEDDPLDSYMRALTDDKPDKHTISKLKLELVNLEKSRENTLRLINLARPANLPPLVTGKAATNPGTTAGNKGKLPIFGKRKLVPVKFPTKPTNVVVATDDQPDDEEEEEETEEKITKMNPAERLEAAPKSSSNRDSDPVRQAFEDFNAMLPVIEEELTKLDRNSADLKAFEVKQDTVIKWMDDLKKNRSNDKLAFKISKELRALLMDIEESHSTGCKKEQANEASDDDEAGTAEEIEAKKRKKNQRRVEQRQHKAEIEKQKGYKEDAAKEDYNMWVPPSNQSGDGRTSLNDKLGY